MHDLFTGKYAAFIGPAFAITAGTFGAMSIYANVTKKDLSGWGTFLFMGLIGVFIAGIVMDRMFTLRRRALFNSVLLPRIFEQLPDPRGR